MKKFLIAMALMPCALMAGAKLTGSVTTDPSPVIAQRPVTITVTTGDLGSDVYLFSWFELGSEVFGPLQWDDVLNDKFRMTGSNGVYSITVNSIKDLFGLTDDQLSRLTRMGIIARNKSDQTEDLFAAVEQAPVQQFSGGDGSEGNPWQIATPADLLELSGNSSTWGADCHFVQTATIAAPAGMKPIGSMASPFRGSYDGDGFSIVGLALNVTAIGTPAGLFGAIDSAEITGLAVTGAEVSGTTYTAILVGYATSGSIEKCYTSGTVNATNLGAGGLVGVNEGASITDCYSTATVVAEGQYAAGGLVGKNLGTIANSYATGSVKALNYAGGLVGANYGTIANSASVNASIEGAGNYVARFGGNNNARNTSSANLAWEAMPAATDWTDHGDHASTSVNLHQRDTFDNTLGWDFDNTWGWQTAGANGYPVLTAMKEEQPLTMPLRLYGGTTEVDLLPIDNSSQPRYFNLMGIPVDAAKARPGVYIRANGNKFDKVIL